MVQNKQKRKFIGELVTASIENSKLFIYHKLQINTQSTEQNGGGPFRRRRLGAGHLGTVSSYEEKTMKQAIP